jgi:colicin import membrane protein
MAFDDLPPPDMAFDDLPGPDLGDIPGPDFLPLPDFGDDDGEAPPLPPDEDLHLDPTVPDFDPSDLPAFDFDEAGEAPAVPDFNADQVEQDQAKAKLLAKEKRKKEKEMELEKKREAAAARLKAKEEERKKQEAEQKKKSFGSRIKVKTKKSSFGSKFEKKDSPPSSSGAPKKKHTRTRSASKLKDMFESQNAEREAKLSVLAGEKSKGKRKKNKSSKNDTKSKSLSSAADLSEVCDKFKPSKFVASICKRCKKNKTAHEEKVRLAEEFAASAEGIAVTAALAEAEAKAKEEAEQLAAEKLAKEEGNKCLLYDSW